MLWSLNHHHSGWVGAPNRRPSQLDAAFVTCSCVLAEEVASNTHGFVGADLAQLCTEAALTCIRGLVRQPERGGGGGECGEWLGKCDSIQIS